MLRQTKPNPPRTHPRPSQIPPNTKLDKLHSENEIDQTNLYSDNIKVNPTKFIQ